MTQTRFNRLFQLAVVACCCLAWSSSPTLADDVTFEWVTVGNPNNAGDVQAGGTFGAVAYTYRISKYEVTNAQYTSFLNAVDPAGENTRDLYNSNMSSDVNGGINFDSAAANGSKYSIKPGRDNNPVTWVSFFDAMRLANWLHNGQGMGDTESGVYNIGNGLNETRAGGARYFIPNQDEWYKAAFHKNDGVTGNYWDYPTSSDTDPYSDNPDSLNTPDDTNTANFYKDDTVANGFDDGFAVTGSTSFDDTQNYLTDVGAYSTSLSPYGTFDQGGNVWEWNEAVFNGAARVMRGGAFFSFSFALSSTFPSNGFPGNEFSDMGIRVAAIADDRTEIAPDSFLVTRGTYVSGGLPELAESDNMDLSLRRSIADTQSRTVFEVKGISPVAIPSSFEFTLEGAVFARSNVVQTIELFDYDAAEWELVDTTNANRAPMPDKVVTATPAGDLSRFVEAGTMCIAARVRYQSDSPRQRFASNTDQAVWTIGQ